MPATRAAQIVDHPTRQRIGPVPFDDESVRRVYVPTQTAAERVQLIQAAELAADALDADAEERQRQANECRAYANMLRHQPSWEG